MFVITRVNKHEKSIREMGFKLIPIEIERHGKNLITELKLVLKILKIYKEIKPDIVHQIAIKPILYGTVAAIFSNVNNVVNTFPGLGYVFESSKKKDSLIRFFLISVYKLIFRIKPVKVIVQNSDNAQFLINNKISRERDISIIKGSGVDLTEYIPGSPSSSAPVVLFASRLLWQKGVSDFVDAAILVKKINQIARFVIVGEPDVNNPNSIPESTLKDWNDKGIVEWWGYRENMAEIISQARVVVLPTFYGEGVPKILIEAAASAVPIITTDTPGCREIVIHGVNGFLVSVHDPVAIAKHLDKLMSDDQLCLSMGAEGRKLVEAEFSIEKVNAETLQIYESMLGA